MAVKATVFIPTYNGEKYLKEILEAIVGQEADYSFEVLIIDSGSTDSTLDIIKKYTSNHDNIRLIKIPNSEFGHGKTRNYAAKLAKGEFVVYLSHDAIPAHPHWLNEMLRPFTLNDKVVAVLGKQDPRIGCFPLMKYDIQGVFRRFGPDGGITLFQKTNDSISQQELDFLSFYSDVNSATRRNFLLNDMPYRDVPYSEDMLFGQDVINAGLIKAYAPSGNVVHSNDISLKEYNKRMFDETAGLQTAGNDIHRLGVWAVMRNAARGALGDSVRIMRDSQYSTKRKLYWLVVNPLYHVQRWRGIAQATKVRAGSSEAAKKYSLEESLKKTH